MSDVESCDDDVPAACWLSDTPDEAPWPSSWVRLAIDSDPRGPAVPVNGGLSRWKELAESAASLNDEGPGPACDGVMLSVIRGIGCPFLEVKSQSTQVDTMCDRRAYRMLGDAGSGLTHQVDCPLQKALAWRGSEIVTGFPLLFDLRVCAISTSDEEGGTRTDAGLRPTDDGHTNRAVRFARWLLSRPTAWIARK